MGKKYNYTVSGTITVDIQKTFEASSWKEAQEEIENWETWGLESVLDIVEITGHQTELDHLVKSRKAE